MKLSYSIFSVFLIQLFSVTFAFRTKFYENGNFTKLLYEGIPTDECINFPEVRALAILTDVCVIAYNKPNCLSSDWKEKYRNNKVNARSYSYESFHVCSEDQSEPQLNIDITKHYLTQNRDPPALKRYKDVCSCVNIKTVVEDLEKWSINSNGHDFNAYFEPDCAESKWNAKKIQLLYSQSTNMQNYFRQDKETNETFKVQSIGPDTNSKYYKTRCIRKINQNFTIELRDKEMYYNVSSVIVDLETKYAQTHEEMEIFKNNFTGQFKNFSAVNDFVLGQNVQLQKQLRESLQNLEQMQGKMEAAVKTLENIAEQSKNTLKLFEDKMEKQKDDIHAICA